MKTNSKHSLVTGLVLGTLLGALQACTSAQTTTYDTPQQAMLCIADVMGTDAQSIEHCVGPGAFELLDSGDAAADREDAQEIKQRIQAGVAFEDLGAERKVALLGDERWPFPIPLVKENGRWRFDLASAREEIMNRRIGSNELLTIATLHEYVDAQREYFSQGSDGNPPAFARKLISSESKHDGLYWPSVEEELESPFGPLIAGAAYEEDEHSGGEKPPFHGYYYRTLRSQGKNASGGAKSYIDDKGRMTGGCALLAWPAKHGSTGVMTFQVSAQGVVFQKDLGPDTERVAETIKEYDPSETWHPTED